METKIMNIVMSLLLCLISWTAICYCLITVAREYPDLYSISFPEDYTEGKIKFLIQSTDFYKSLPDQFQLCLIRFASREVSIIDVSMKGGVIFSKHSFVRSNGDRMIKLEVKHKGNGDRSKEESVVITDQKEHSEVLENVAERIVCEFICELFAATFRKVNKHLTLMNIVLDEEYVPFSWRELGLIETLIEQRGNSEQELVELLEENNRLSQPCLKNDFPKQGNLSTYQHAKNVANKLKSQWEVLNQKHKQFIDERLPILPFKNIVKQPSFEDRIKFLRGFNLLFSSKG